MYLDLVFGPQPPVRGLSMVGGVRRGGTFLSLKVAYISNLSLLQNPIKSEVRYKSPPSWGIGLSLVLTVGRDWGINFLASDKPAYLFLTSY